MWTEAFHVLLDPGHMVAEVAMEILFFLLGLLANWVMIKYRERYRDRRHGHK